MVKHYTNLDIYTSHSTHISNIVLTSTWLQTTSPPFYYPQHECNSHPQHCTDLNMETTHIPNIVQTTTWIQPTFPTLCLPQHGYNPHRLHCTNLNIDISCIIQPISQHCTNLNMDTTHIPNIVLTTTWIQPIFPTL